MTISTVLVFGASVIAAGVSAYNAGLNKFARLRWWDRKADAYTRVVEALAEMVYYHEEHIAASDEGRTIPAKVKEEIDQHWRHSHAELKKASAVGAFLISPKAETALRRMWQETGQVVSYDWYREAESHYVAAQDCLKSVVSCAKNELQNKSWRTWF
jgi:hypothetical protein